MSRVVAEIVVVPFVGGPGGLSTYVAAVEKTLRSFNLEVMLTPMGTILEGEWDEVMKVVKDCFNELNKDCSRIGVYIKIDYRDGPESRLESKIKSLEDKIGRKLQT